MTMKQSRSIISPATGTITEIITISVGWVCRTDTEPSVVVAEGKAVAEAGDELRSTSLTCNANNGTTGDGGSAAVHPSYPISL